jgi:hypothetical protein
VEVSCRICLKSLRSIVYYKFRQYGGSTGNWSPSLQRRFDVPLRGMGHVLRITSRHISQHDRHYLCRQNLSTPAPRKFHVAKSNPYVRVMTGESNVMIYVMELPVIFTRKPIRAEQRTSRDSGTPPRASSWVFSREFSARHPVSRIQHRYHGQADELG